MYLRVVNINDEAADAADLALIDNRKANLNGQATVDATVMGSCVDKALEVASVSAWGAPINARPCGIETDVNLYVGTVIVKKFSTLRCVSIPAVSCHIGDESPIQVA